MSIIGRLTVGAILAGTGVWYEAPAWAAVIGGLIIGASAIPVFYGDRIERLKAGRRPVRVLDDRFEDRMAEMEHRHREQMAQLEEMHTGQITELEERIDFTERLLTERREQIGPS